MYFMTWANNGAPLGFGSECYYSPWKEPLIAYQFDGQSNSWKITGHSELNVTDFHPVSQGAIRWLLKGDVPPKDQIGPWPQRQAERLAEHAKSILRTRETVLSWKRKKLPVDLIIGAYTRFRYLYDLERDTLEEPLFDPQTVPKDCLCVYPSGKNKDGIYNLVWVACSWCSPLYVINLHDMPDGSVEAIALLGISHID
jgi:hypothetical protein